MKAFFLAILFLSISCVSVAVGWPYLRLLRADFIVSNFYSFNFEDIYISKLVKIAAFERTSTSNEGIPLLPYYHADVNYRDYGVMAIPQKDTVEECDSGHVGLFAVCYISEDNGVVFVATGRYNCAPRYSKVSNLSAPMIIPFHANSDKIDLCNSVFKRDSFECRMYVNKATSIHLMHEACSGGYINLARGELKYR